MMLPVARFKGQPVGMVTTTTPCLTICTDPIPHWLWLARWSTASYPTTPPLVLYPPAVWVPEHTQLIQWERPAVEVVPLLPPFYRSSHLHAPHPLTKLVDCWISPEEIFQRRGKPRLLSNQIIQRQGGHAPHSSLLLPPTRFPGRVRRDVKTRDGEPEDSTPSAPLLLFSVFPHRQLRRAPPPTGGAYWDWTGLQLQRSKEEWPLVLSNRDRGSWLRPITSLNRRAVLPTQEGVLGLLSGSRLCMDPWAVLPIQVKEVPPSFSSRFSSRFTLLTDCRHKKRGMSRGRGSYEGALLLRTERSMDNNKQCVAVSANRAEEEDEKEEEEEEEKEEGNEERRRDKRPVASTPVPGSPWCVVWTGDDRVFFFNPTIHLSVWETPGELIGRDISRIIEDPPHKRKRSTSSDSSASCQSSGHNGNDEDEHHLKRNRIEEPMLLVPRPEEVKLLPLELRVADFREMMLERGVSAFSTWEKELHKMVFDPRYLLLTSDQRKQVFDQFVKSRVKEEYKEKRSKLQKAREGFKQLLEEAKITSRSTFKEFCARYRGDQRFYALNRKKDQEVLFYSYITSLKKRDRENRARLRKMR